MASFLFLFYSLSLLFWHFELFGWLIFSPQSFIYVRIRRLVICCCSKLNSLFILNWEKHTINETLEQLTQNTHIPNIEPKKNMVNYMKMVWRPFEMTSNKVVIWRCGELVSSEYAGSHDTQNLMSIPFFNYLMVYSDWKPCFRCQRIFVHFEFKGCRLGMILVRNST